LPPHRSSPCSSRCPHSLCRSTCCFTNYSFQGWSLKRFVSVDSVAGALFLVLLPPYLTPCLAPGYNGHSACRNIVACAGDRGGEGVWWTAAQHLVFARTRAPTSTGGSSMSPLQHCYSPSPTSSCGVITSLAFSSFFSVVAAAYAGARPLSLFPAASVAAHYPFIHPLCNACFLKVCLLRRWCNSHLGLIFQVLHPTNLILFSPTFSSLLYNPSLIQAF
jgi:hypothetical protein